MFSNIENIIKSNVDDVEKLNLILKVDNLRYDDSDNESDNSSNDAASISSELSFQHAQNVNYNFTSSSPYDEQVEQITATFTNDHLSKIILLNKAQQSLLREAINHHRTLIADVDNKIKSISESIKDQDDDTSKKYFNYKFGSPYFKVRSFCCPHNQDKLIKDKNGEYNQCYLPPSVSWLDCEKKLLVSYVQEQSKLIRVGQLRGQIKQLTNLVYTKNKIQNEVESKIQELTNEIAQWKLKDPAECIFPVKDKTVPIDWMKIGVLGLKGRHSDNEYKAMWYCCLHPELNNSPFPKGEFEKMSDLVKINNFQNWDLIADQLGTNRSGYICCLIYHISQSNRYKKSKWTPEEDAYLLELVENCRVGNYIPWNKVSYFIRNRTKAQIYMRYCYHLATDIRKGRFSKAEDLLLLMFVKKFGPNYSKIATYLPNRTSVQVRERYLNCLQYEGKTQGEWTVAEDTQIENFVMKHGDKAWADLASKFKSKYNRTRNNLRHRWKTLQKFRQTYPNASIEDAPRRKKRKRFNIAKHDDVDNVIDILGSKDLENSESQIKDKKLRLETYNLSAVSGVLSTTQEIEPFFASDKFILHIHTTIRGTFLTQEFSQTSVLDLFFILQIINGRINIPANFNDINGYKYLKPFEKKVLAEVKHFSLALSKSSSVFTDFITKCYDENNAQLIYPDNNLLQFIPPFLQSVSNFDQTLLHCKVVLKYLTWHKSPLSGYFEKKGGRFLRIYKGYLSDPKSELVQIEENIKKTIKTQPCKALLTCKNCSTLRKLLSTDEFKKRLLTFVSLPAMEPFVDKLNTEIDDIVENRSTDSTKIFKNVASLRKRGRPKKKKV